MQTDATLTLKDVTVVIDAKYYWQALVKRFDVGQEKIRSGHLNQMYAYLKNVALRNTNPLEGILLYPKVSQSLDLTYSIGNVGLHVKTLDLNIPWKRIRDQLLGIADLRPDRPPAVFANAASALA
jgi:5-methylcytosine-specific restriction enzyme subunit McrC